MQRSFRYFLCTVGCSCPVFHNRRAQGKGAKTVRKTVREGQAEQQRSQQSLKPMPRTVLIRGASAWSLSLRRK